MARRGERDDLDATCAEQYLRSHQKRIGRLLRKARKGSVEVEIGTGGEDFDLHPDRARPRTSTLCDRKLTQGLAGVTRTAKRIAPRHELLEKPEPLTRQGRHCTSAETGGVAAQAGRSFGSTRRGPGSTTWRKYDRTRCVVKPLSRGRVRAGVGDDNRNAATDQIAGEFRQPIELIVGPARFNRDVAALDESSSYEAPVKCGDSGSRFRGCAHMKIANHRHRRLLCARRDRPRPPRRRAA